MASKVNLDVSERLDITCRKGDTFSLTVTLKDSLGVVLPLLTDGYTMFMQVYDASKRSSTPVITSPGQGVQSVVQFDDFVLDNSGNVTIKATALTMNQVKSGRYKYDLQFILPVTGEADTHTTVLFGSFIVNEDVSKVIL